MFAVIRSAGLKGIEGYIVDVEADASNGLPGFVLTGALAPETKEGQFRVWNALRNSGIYMRPQKFTVNLSPADVRKNGTAFDLPIAVALLCATGVLNHEELKDYAFAGETGLDGSIKAVRGILPISEAVCRSGIRHLVVPAANVQEASLRPELTVHGVSSLKEMLLCLKKGWPKEQEAARTAGSGERTEAVYDVDFSEVHGQHYLKRAAEIAVSGRHNILFTGPAGTGKTMIAKRMVTIMPDLTRDEDIRISKVYSICGLLPEGKALLSRRPFRSPHHSISEAAFTGGGINAMPGEISLASGGILFMDELPLFPRSVIEDLREPLEEGTMTVSRFKATCTYPADVQLVAAMNNCACGYYPDRNRCTCSPSLIRTYMGRLSRPFLERIDICAEAVPVNFDTLTAGNRELPEESSALIRSRVERTVQLQRDRYEKVYGPEEGQGFFNGKLGIKDVERFCVLGKEEQNYMKELFHRRSISGRMYHKILKVARTIADMEGSEQIRTEHLREAAGLRSIEDRLFSGRGFEV